MNSNRRVLIFADWDNTFYSAKTFNRKLDWLKLRDYLASYQEGRELIEMVLYIGLPPDRERFQEVRKQREKHIYWAKSNGFLVVAKEGKSKGEDFENNVDIVLVTGDSDFAHLAEKLRRRGMRVEVASVEQSLGNDLKNAANSVIDLIAVFDTLQAQNNNQDYHPIGSTTIFN
jgi:uncharacterized LabA/DUF88 family protein